MDNSDEHALRELAALPSLGKVSARMLIEAGVDNVETLRKLGAIECYRRLWFRHGNRATLNFAYALECAIQGIDWRALGDDRKALLKSAAQDVRLMRGSSADPKRGRR